nr:ribonuclease H-like domain-containing protein [Tanacetum cinerariifolium]
MNEFYEMKGIRMEFSVARTPQQNGVAKKKNRTLIEAARTMLADSKLPTTFRAEAVNTACYVQNRVLVIKPHNKTPCKLFLGRKPALSFMRPFRCPDTILNTLDHLGKFDRKSNDGFFVGYSINSKALRVFNTRTKFVEENLHINFLENKPNVARTGPNWMFDIHTLTMFINYQPVFTGNQTNGNAGTKANIDAGKAKKKAVLGLQYVLLSLLTFDSQGPKSSEDEVANDARKKSNEVPRKENGVQDPPKEGDKNDQENDVRDQEETLRKQFEQEFERVFGLGEAVNTNSTNRLNTISSPVNAISLLLLLWIQEEKEPKGMSLKLCLDKTRMLMATVPTGCSLLIFIGAYDDEVEGAVADFNNLELTTVFNPIPTTRIHKDHPKEQIIGDPLLVP